MANNHDDNSSIWLVRELETARRQAGEALFSDILLQNPAQHFLLFVIEHSSNRGEPLSQGDIARALKLSPATVTASLRFLEKYDLIQREPDKTDLRKNLVTITDAGREMSVKCRAAMDSLEEAMFEGFSEEELEVLTGYFDRMCSNLRAISKNKKEDPEF